MTTQTRGDHTGDELPPDTIGGEHGGAFARDFETTSTASWVAVAVMLIGVVAVGVGVTMFLVSSTVAWILIGAGVVVGLLGLVQARRAHIMRHTS